MLFPHQTDNSSGHSSLEYRSSIFIARIPRCWKITRFLDRYTDLVKPEQSMYPIHGCLGIRNIDASEVRRKRQSADRRLSACASITVISELCHKLDYAPRNWMRCLNVAFAVHRVTRTAHGSQVPKIHEAYRRLEVS